MAITKLRVQAANVMAKVISAAFKGLCRISFIVPWTLEINIEEEEWEKLLEELDDKRIPYEVFESAYEISAEITKRSTGPNL